MAMQRARMQPSSLAMGSSRAISRNLTIPRSMISSRTAGLLSSPRPLVVVPSRRGASASPAAASGHAAPPEHNSGLHVGSPGDQDQSPTAITAKVQAGLLKMARLQNLVPAFFLTLLGAWIGTGRCTSAVLSCPAVFTVALVSGSISVASMLINDYFDWASGVDAVNSPSKPLVSGEVTPNVVLLVSLYMYAGILAVACLMDSLTLRSVIAASAGLTILYTPLLKRVTAVKNLVVAAIIAASPLAGALAVGAEAESLGAVVNCCGFAFLGVTYREIIMDINDAEGDGKAGIKTLPVLIGKPKALAVACYSLLCGTVLGWNAAFHGQGAWPFMNLDPMAVRYLCCAVLCGIMAPVYASAAKVFTSNFDKQQVDRAIEQALPHMAMGMLLLAFRA